MKVRGVIFSSAMVNALLAGRKTQTRRLASSPMAKGEPGDLLYVREAFARNGYKVGEPVYFMADGLHQHMGRLTESNGSVTEFWTDCWVKDGKWHPGGAFKPSIHMPRWASRVCLPLIQVRQQRLQDITEADAEAEGLLKVDVDGRSDWCITPERRESYACSARGAFYLLWNSLHDKPGERWDDNPDVVALSFDVEKMNIDALLERRGEMRQPVAAGQRPAANAGEQAGSADKRRDGAEASTRCLVGRPRSRADAEEGP